MVQTVFPLPFRNSQYHDFSFSSDYNKLYENTVSNQIHNTWTQIKQILSWNTITLLLRFVCILCITITVRLTSRRFAGALPLILVLPCFKIILEYLHRHICNVGAMQDKHRDQVIQILRSLEFPLYLLLHIYVFLSSFDDKSTRKKDTTEELNNLVFVHMKNKELQEMQDRMKIMHMQTQEERDARRKEQD